MKKALVIVDVQNDFCSGGGFPVPNGEEVVKPLNKMLVYARKNNWTIVASRDWHSNKLFSKDDCSKHCIQGTRGAEYHPDLNIKEDVVIISKGTDDLGDKHYSAFNGDEISLEKLLKDAKVEEVYIGGLALDYCVKHTAIDSVRRGFKTFVLLDACRAVDNKPSSEKAVIEEMRREGIKFIKTSDLLKLG